MAMYEVEVEGHYCAVIEVEADSPEDAESKAIETFEYEYDVVGSYSEGWDHTSIVAVNEQEEDEDY